jgi:hypothetical protein
MFAMKLHLFIEFLIISTIYCNAINSNLLKVENSEYTLACSKITAQRITSFTVLTNVTLNCFDEYLPISFEIIDIRQQNKTFLDQAFLTNNGCCMVERQLTSKSCKRIRRYNIKFKFIFFNTL